MTEEVLMKRCIQPCRNLRVIYSSQRILAASEVSGKEQAERIEADLLNLFKQHVSKISDEVRFESSIHVVEQHDTGYKDWRIELIILYPGVERWDNNRQASDSIWVYYDPRKDSIYMYHTNLDDVHFGSTIPNFKQVQNCKAVEDLPLDWTIIERNIRNRLQIVEDYEAKRSALSNVNPTQELKRVLEAHGISTTPRGKYELVWHDSGSRGGYGTPHTTTYTANGDWLACFGMKYRGSPTVRKLLDDYGYDLIETIEEYASEYPTVDELLDGVGLEWASPDEYSWVESLTNLTTGEILYKVDVNPEDFSDYE